ncbi:MAG: hypothetical protein ACLT14_07315 [Butyricicoccaceae bacterium]
MKKRLLAALLTGALALSLTACGGGTDSSAADGGDTASTHDGPYKISMVLKTNAAEFWNIVQAGAEAYEDEHPDQVSLDIKGLRLRPTTRSSSTPSRPTLRLSPTMAT